MKNMIMKKILCILNFVSLSMLYGMEQEIKNPDKELVVLESNNMRSIIHKRFLPEAWYRSICEHAMVKNGVYDDQGRLIIKLSECSAEVLPLITDILYYAPMLSAIKSEYKADKLAYKAFKKGPLFRYQLTIEKAKKLLCICDYLCVPKPFLAGLARILVELAQGNELNLEDVPNLEARKQINRYLYILGEKKEVNEEIAEFPLEELIEHGKRDWYTYMETESDVELELCNLPITHLYSLYKFQTKHDIHLHSISYLTISDCNRLHLLPKDLLRWCPHLKGLSLLENKNLKAIPTGFFNYCPALVSLGLSSSGFTKVPFDEILKCTDLYFLDILNIPYTTIPAEFFERCTKLETLYIGSENTTELPFSGFEKLKNLTELGVERSPHLEGVWRGKKVPAFLDAALEAGCKTIEALNANELCRESKVQDDDYNQHPLKKQRNEE
jgi:hypothetical protein